MRRSVLAFVLVLGLASGSARAQDTAAIDAAYSRIEMKIVESTRTPPEQRQKVYEELHGLCGAFLDQHMRAASQVQLLKAGKLWFMLAGRLNTPDQEIEKRIAALKTLSALPSELAAEIRRVEGTLGLKVGVMAPAWTAVDVVDGSPVSSEKFSGKLLLVHFSATWSDPCKALQKHKLDALQKRYAKDNRLVILGLGAPLQGDTAEAHKKHKEENGYAWPMAFDAAGAAGRAYNVKTIPYLVLVDVDGRILSIGPGINLIEQVEKLLVERLGPGEAPPAEAPSTEAPPPGR